MRPLFLIIQLPKVSDFTPHGKFQWENGTLKAAVVGLYLHPKLSPGALGRRWAVGKLASEMASFVRALFSDSCQYGK